MGKAQTIMPKNALHYSGVVRTPFVGLAAT